MTADEGRAWCWHDDAGDIVIKSQPAIAIYPGPAGVVIRQERDWCDDADAMVWFAVDRAPAVAAAILQAAGLEPGAVTPEPVQGGRKSKNANGAERQRRYRESKKKEPTIEPDLLARDARDVTESDGGDVTRNEGAT